ncbi:Transposase (plasmid) [Corynebacterium occultum]|uniref:Transposase n=1 Tax=Corynebacterium occultum TaxID=2675219 RepID=A0A6B8W5C1_9CORY|nr:Transposase [Corynebacterium occultum]
MSNRRIFTEEFKAGAVQLVVSSGRSIKEVATELGIKEGTLGAWCHFGVVGRGGPRSW